MLEEVTSENPAHPLIVTAVCDSGGGQAIRAGPRVSLKAGHMSVPEVSRAPAGHFSLEAHGVVQADGRVLQNCVSTEANCVQGDGRSTSLPIPIVEGDTAAIGRVPVSETASVSRSVITETTEATRALVSGGGPRVIFALTITAAVFRHGLPVRRLPSATALAFKHFRRVQVRNQGLVALKD